VHGYGAKRSNTSPFKVRHSKAKTIFSNLLNLNARELKALTDCHGTWKAIAAAAAAVCIYLLHAWTLDAGVKSHRVNSSMHGLD